MALPKLREDKTRVDIDQQLLIIDLGGTLFIHVIVSHLTGLVHDVCCR